MSELTAFGQQVRSKRIKKRKKKNLNKQRLSFALGGISSQPERIIRSTTLFLLSASKRLLDLPLILTRRSEGRERIKLAHWYVRSDAWPYRDGMGLSALSGN